MAKPRQSMQWCHSKQLSDASEVKSLHKNIKHHVLARLHEEDNSTCNWKCLTSLVQTSSNTNAPNRTVDIHNLMIPISSEEPHQKEMYSSSSEFIWRNHTMASPKTAKEDSSIVRAPHPMTPACVRIDGMAMMPTMDAPVRNLVKFTHLHAVVKLHKKKKLQKQFSPHTWNKILQRNIRLDLCYGTWQKKTQSQKMTSHYVCEIKPCKKST